jgi:hypothetical protein
MTDNVSWEEEYTSSSFEYESLRIAAAAATQVHMIDQSSFLEPGFFELTKY